jgi:hypothetical protein
MELSKNDKKWLQYGLSMVIEEDIANYNKLPNYVRANDNKKQTEYKKRLEYLNGLLKKLGEN